MREDRSEKLSREVDALLQKWELEAREDFDRKLREDLLSRPELDQRAFRSLSWKRLKFSIEREVPCQVAATGSILNWLPRPI